MQAQRLLYCAFGGCLVWQAVWQAATKRCELNVGFTAFIKTPLKNYIIFINDAVVLAI
jgi:hypothetical protein